MRSSAFKAGNELAIAADACRSRGREWITQHLNRFVPSDPVNPDKTKEVTELALLYGITQTWFQRKDEWNAGIAAFLLEVLGQPEFRERVVKRPADYNPYLVAYLALRSAGHRLPDYERALVSAKRAGFPAANEVIPYRELELQYMLWKAGLKRRPPGYGRVYRSTTLGRCRTPVYLSDNDVYSITHTLFYLTDFKGPAVNMPPREHEKAATLVETLLVHYWREKNWDIFAELLINLVGLNRTGTCLFRTSATALFDAWSGEGHLPGPHFHPAADKAPDVDYVFEHCYHTTLVGVLFCDAHLCLPRL